MSGQNTIIAAFDSGADAQAAAADLQAAGFTPDDIRIHSNNSGDLPRGTNRSAEGGVKGWFKSLFGEEEQQDRSRYERAIAKGKCLLRVDVNDNQIPAVEEILNRHSPVDVHEAEEDLESRALPNRDTVGAPEPSPNRNATRERMARSGPDSEAIPVMKEEIQIGKRQVLRGGVRVFSRLVEEPVQEDISLRDEHVRVDRRPVNRSATSADLSGSKEQVIEVQEFAEEPVVSKRSRVVEEVRVGKDVSERTETIRDTARHTEVSVDRTPGSSREEFDDSEFRNDFQNRYAGRGASYDTYQPAYRYGYDMASDPQYQGRQFDEVESDLRAGYGQRYPNSKWEEMKDAIRSGWDRMTGRARTRGAAR
jgi:uncharacterized protein (TIGR02271 family)